MHARRQAHARTCTHGQTHPRTFTDTPPRQGELGGARVHKDNGTCQKTQSLTCRILKRLVVLGRPM
jgi:hypothetical protein